MKAWLATALALAAVALAAPRPAARGQAVPPGPDPGDLLIASRELDDPNFARTVVLLLHTGPQGAQGIVINRRTLVRIAAALPQIEELADRPDPVYWGGPVEPQAALLLVRSSEPPPDAALIVDDVYEVRAREAIERLLRRGLPESSVRLYSGYAGWTAGQLEAEIASRAWHLRPADAASVFDDDLDALWDRLVRIARAPIA